MSTGRQAKRSRKKARRHERQEMYRRYYEQRRRRRRAILGTITGLIVIGAVVSVFVFVLEPDKREPAATPEGTTSTTGPCKKADKPKVDDKKEYDEPEDQDLDPKKTTLLRLETTCGVVDILLDVKNSPKTANSVAFLAHEGFYDGLSFHRVVPGFVVQGGDPNGDGTGGPGYKVEEAPGDGHKYKDWEVAMAKGGAEPAGTSGSQFFVVLPGGGDQLTPDYAVLGKVVTGQQVMERIARSPGEPVDDDDRTYIKRASITVS